MTGKGEGMAAKEAGVPGRGLGVDAAAYMDTGTGIE